jgi:hypothetical protein
LGVVEVSRNSGDGICDFFAEITFGCLFEVFEKLSGNFIIDFWASE